MPNKPKTPEELQRELAMKNASPDGLGTPKELGQSFIQQREKLAAAQGSTSSVAARQMSGGSDLQAHATGAAIEQKKQELLKAEGQTNPPVEQQLMAPAKKEVFLQPTIGALGATMREDKKFHEDLKKRTADIMTSAAELPKEQQQQFIDSQQNALNAETVQKNIEIMHEEFAIAAESIFSKFLRPFKIKVANLPIDKVDDFVGVLEDKRPVAYAKEVSAIDPSQGRAVLEQRQKDIRDAKVQLQYWTLRSPTVRANPEERIKVDAAIIAAERELFLAFQEIAPAQVSQNLNTSK